MRLGYIASVTNKLLIGKLKVCINAFIALTVSLIRLVTENGKREKLFLHVHKQEHPRKLIVPNSSHEFLKK